MIPPDFAAVGEFYEEFEPVSDEACIALLAGRDPRVDAGDADRGTDRADSASWHIVIRV